MQKAYVDLTKFDTERGQSLRKAVERALAHATSQKHTPVVFLVRPSHASEVECIVMDREQTNVVGCITASEVLTYIRGQLKKAAGPVPNDSTEYVYTFDPDVREPVFGWKNAGWNVYVRPGADILLARPPSTGMIDAGESVIRSRNRKYEVAKSKAKRLRVYAEWRTRRAIYDAIEATINAEGGITLVDLKRSVMRAARAAAASQGLELKANHFFAANDSVFRVVLGVGVLRSDGGVRVGDRDVPYVVRVTGIESDFRERCDLFILESIINSLGDVTDDQSLSLAHLMYGEGITEAEGGVSLESLDEKFSNLMRRFGSRLQRNEDGYYRVTPEGGEKVQSIAAISR